MTSPCRYCKGTGCESCGKHPVSCGAPMDASTWEFNARWNTFGPPWMGPPWPAESRFESYNVWRELRGPFLPTPDVERCGRTVHEDRPG